MQLVLLGDPVGHSLSPAIHRAALRAVHLAGTYTARRVDREGFLRACAELRAGSLDGANVTMPHKRLAATEADDLSGEARRAGSVNTLVARGGMLGGHSTDVTGIRSVWEEWGLPDDAPVLVLGGGGAAAAAAVALEGRKIIVSTRRPSVAPTLLAATGVEGSTIAWGRGVAGAVVVNATPLGMLGESLPADALAKASGLLDMAYGPATTPAVATVRSAGLPAADGTELLLAQASASFELWTGMTAPVETMRTALQKAQAQRRAGRN